MLENLQQFSGDLWLSLYNLQMSFRNLWSGSGDPQRCPKMFRAVIFKVIFKLSLAIFGRLQVNFSHLWYTWPLFALKCLHTNLRNHCNLHFWCKRCFERLLLIKFIKALSYIFTAGNTSCSLYLVRDQKSPFCGSFEANHPKRDQNLFC